MRLRARWIGPLPRVGDYLMSAVRPRHAHRVEQVTNASSKVRWDASTKAEVRSLQFVVDQVAKASVPRAAKIHPWWWDRREARHDLR